MRLRVLLTSGTRTVDVIWLEHNGTDVYYGGVGWPDKDSYHATGVRHSKTLDERRSEIQQHHRLDDFRGQLQLCTFGLGTDIVDSASATEYTGKEGDSVIWLDSRTLPRQINVFLGLLEVGEYQSLLPVHIMYDLRLVHLVTSTIPWIYVMVLDTSNVESRTHR